MRLERTRSRTLKEPAELWYYATLFRESDAPSVYTREEYETLRSYEPSLYRESYEEFCAAQEKARLRFETYVAQRVSVIRAVSVNRNTINAVPDMIEQEPDFLGWVVE